MHHFDAHELADSWELRAGLLDEDPADASISACLRECAAALRDIATPSPAPAPVMPPIDPGWTFNHARPKAGESGVWEIGFYDDEDDRFSPIVTVDTASYYFNDGAEPLAKAILARLTATQAPAVEDALQVAVNLRILPAIEEWSDGPHVFVPGYEHCAQALGADPYAATCRAIFGAAKTLGHPPVQGSQP